MWNNHDSLNFHCFNIVIPECPIFLQEENIKICISLESSLSNCKSQFNSASEFNMSPCLWWLKNSSKKLTKDSNAAFWLVEFRFGTIFWRTIVKEIWHIYLNLFSKIYCLFSLFIKVGLVRSDYWASCPHLQ